MTRGDIWWADFGLPFGSEPGFKRPVLIVQDNAYNKSKIHTTIVIPITSNRALGEAPGNVYLDAEESKLSKVSVAVVSQIGVIDKKRLMEKLSSLSDLTMDEVEQGIRMVLAL